MGRRRTFNGRVVLVDEVALDQLDGEATLSYTATTDNNQFVFPEELRHGQHGAAPQWSHGAGTALTLEAIVKGCGGYLFEYARWWIRRGRESRSGAQAGRQAR